MQNRFKSKVVWMATFSFILLILKNYGLLEPLGLTVESYNEITTAITGVLVLMGILNDPTRKGEF